MREICDHLHEHLGEILIEWQEITRDEPWLSLPEKHRLDSLPGVVHTLLDAALCSVAVRAQFEELIAKAAKHGHDRREQSFEVQLILTEYHLLREAFWRFLRPRGPEAYPAISKIDRAITVATAASLYGFNRDELTARGQWPAALHKLLADTPRRLGHPAWGI